MTVFDIGRAQLHALLQAFEIGGARKTRIVEVFDGIAGQCADRDTETPPRWSGLSDDCSPIEWSIAFRKGAPDIRVLVEAQADPPSLASYMEASRRLTGWLVEQTGADDVLASKVLEVFPPLNATALAAAYHGVEFLHGGSIRTKLYLNPAVAGDRWSAAQRAFERIGLHATVEALRRAVGPMDLPLVAFDLEPMTRARVKLYLRARSLEDYERIGEMCAIPCAADFRPTTIAMYGQALVTRPPFIAVHLDAAKSGIVNPPTRAVYSLPVLEGSGATSSTDKIAGFLDHHHLDAQGFRRAIHELTKVTPQGPTRNHWPFALPSWLSIQREADGSPRVTVYFRLRAFAARYGWLSADDSPTTWPSPVADVAS
jgi:hypothetical protein